MNSTDQKGGGAEFPRLEREEKPKEILEAGTDEPLEEATIKTVMITERLGEQGERGIRKTDLAEIRALDGNDYCIDCGKINPTFTSINLGILMCQLCSIQHQ